MALGCVWRHFAGQGVCLMCTHSRISSRVALSLDDDSFCKVCHVCCVFVEVVVRLAQLPWKCNQKASKKRSPQHTPHRT
eukprot:5548722-Amphidinium_carterae.1